MLKQADLFIYIKSTFKLKNIFLYLLSSEMFPSEESSEAFALSWDSLRELWSSTPKGKPFSASSLVGLS